MGEPLPLLPRTPEEFARALHQAFRRGFAWGKDDTPPYHGMSLTERTNEAFVEQYPDLSFAADGRAAPEFDWPGIWDAVNQAPARSAADEGMDLIRHVSTGGLYPLGGRSR